MLSSYHALFRTPTSLSAMCNSAKWRNFANSVASSDDTHEDFKPKFKSASEPVKGDVESIIKADLASHPVFLYMKGVPAAPSCGFSNMACRVLDAYGVQYGSRNVLEDPAVREGIKKFSKWPTIPQIFIEGEFVGGADILMSMHESGELEKLLQPVRQKQATAG